MWSITGTLQAEAASLPIVPAFAACVWTISGLNSLIIFFIFQINLLGKTLMDEQDWYEKDLSDFDDPQLSDEEHEG